MTEDDPDTETPPTPKQKGPGRPRGPKFGQPRRTGNPLGRPSLISEEKIDQIITAISGHLPFPVACELVGVPESTGRLWLKLGGEAKKGKYTDFLRRVREAQGIAQLQAITGIASDPSWQAKAWLLERRHPEHYGRKQAIAHTGPDGEALAISGPAVTFVMALPPGSDNPFDEGQNTDLPPTKAKAKAKAAPLEELEVEDG